MKKIINLFSVLSAEPQDGVPTFSSRDFATQTAGLKEGDELEIHINSPGGCVYEGLAIANAIMSGKFKSVAIIEGIAASMAGVIACACDDVQIAKTALFMIHLPATVVAGTADEIRAAANRVDSVAAQMVKIYKRYAPDLTDAQIVDMMIAETFIGGDSDIGDNVKTIASSGFKFNVNDNLAKMAACLSTGLDVQKLPSIAQPLFAKAGDPNPMPFPGGGAGGPVVFPASSESNIVTSETISTPASDPGSSPNPAQSEDPVVIIAALKQRIAALEAIIEEMKKAEALEEAGEPDEAPDAMAARLTEKLTGEITANLTPSITEKVTGELTSKLTSDLTAKFTGELDIAKKQAAKFQSEADQLKAKNEKTISKMTARQKAVEQEAATLRGQLALYARQAFPLPVEGDGAKISVTNWGQALKACNGDYVSARRKFPQVFDACMKPYVQRK